MPDPTPSRNCSTHNYPATFRAENRHAAILETRKGKRVIRAPRTCQHGDQAQGVFHTDVRQAFWPASREQFRPRMLGLREPLFQEPRGNRGRAVWVRVKPNETVVSSPHRHGHEGHGVVAELIFIILQNLCLPA